MAKSTKLTIQKEEIPLETPIAEIELNARPKEMERCPNCGCATTNLLVHSLRCPMNLVRE